MPKATRRWTADELRAISANKTARWPTASPATIERLRYEPRTALGPHNKGAAQVVCQAEPKPRQSRTKKPTTPERDILAACLQLLAVHPKVAWAARQNTGGMALEGRFVKFGMTGAADITGMLRGGRRLEVECKRSGKMPSPAQNAYLFMVNKDGGWACWVDSVSKLSDLLNALP